MDKGVMDEFYKKIDSIDKKKSIISRQPKIRNKVNHPLQEGVVKSKPIFGSNPLANTKGPEETYIPNQSLLHQVPNETAQQLGYGPVRGNLSQIVKHFHPYGSDTTSVLTNAAALQRKAARVNTLGRIATANLAIASLARKRAGLDNSDLTMRSIAVNNAVNNATIKANKALLLAKQSVEQVINTHTKYTMKEELEEKNQFVPTINQRLRAVNMISKPPQLNPHFNNPNNNINNPPTEEDEIRINAQNQVNLNLSRRYNNYNGYNGLKNLSRKKKKLKAQHKYQLRTAAGETWVDPTMTDWPEKDFRIFCGDLGNEVSDTMLTQAFSKYKSFAKARVVRDKRTGKSKGFGFVSFLEPDDFIKAFKEMNGKYVGNRPIKLRKSTWKERMKKVKNFKL